MRRIGVFDSGVGGLSVANAIEAALPGYDVAFRNDAEHVPYGNRELQEIYELGEPVVRSLIEQDGAQVVVIACNTVTTNFIGRLREQFAVPLVGMEPSVKPAAEATRTGTITVCATPRTLESPRYAWLKETYAPGVRVLEPDCSDWSYMIESNQVNEQRIAEIVDASIGRVRSDRARLHPLPLDRGHHPSLRRHARRGAPARAAGDRAAPARARGDPSEALTECARLAGVAGASRGVTSQPRCRGTRPTFRDVTPLQHRGTACTTGAGRPETLPERAPGRRRSGADRKRAW